MAIAIFPILLIVVGALVYALSSNAKGAEMGRLTFACGMLALAFALAAHVVHLG